MFDSLRWTIWVPLIFCATLFTVGCGPDKLVDETAEVPGGIWTAAFRPRFSFDVADTTKLYNMRLSVTHSGNYAWENVYVKLHTFFPDGKQTEYTKSIDLAKASGEWLGKGWGSEKTLVVPLIDTFFFNRPGAYALEIEPFMRTDSLQGITALGLIVEDCGRPRKQ
jgi:gliding motility-associated lipoprotein GldH